MFLILEFFLEEEDISFEQIWNLEYNFGSENKLQTNATKKNNFL